MQLKNDNVLKYLNPTRNIFAVLGNICKNPRLMKDPDVYLDEDDFLQDFHKIVFTAINNIAYSGEVKSITEVDIDNFLAPHDKLYRIWDEEDGIKYVSDCIEHSNEETFKHNYDRLKKFSLLRDYTDCGIDISDIYDFQSTDLKVQAEGKKRVDNMELDDIVEHFTLKMTNLRNKWNLSKNSENFKAGDDLDTLLDEMNEEPEFGYPFQNGYYNAIFRGMRHSKFMLRSATTGGGKTRQSLADMCTVSCSHIYSYEKQDWVLNGEIKPTLFISTELEKRELQTVMLAFISGIDEDAIKNGNYDPNTLARLKKAIEILKEAPIYAVYVDDFSISDIESIIEQYIIEHDVEFVAFDYIQMTPKLSRTMQRVFGSNLREDQILVQFSGALKLLAKKFDVYIISSTQLNRNSKDRENRDTQSLRGGSATADKVDHGIMSFRATQADHDDLEHILERGHYGIPNFSHWVYKNRSGRNNVIIWTNMDMGTMREQVLFMTDYDFNIINKITPVNISTVVEETTGFGGTNNEEETEEVEEKQQPVQEQELEYEVDF